MLLSTVENLATILPALATLTEGTTRTGRAGKKLRLYRPEPCLTSGPMADAVKTLLEAGYVTKVYEADRVYTPKLEAGTVLWAFRTTHRVRTAVVVEVALGR